jgi:hypothetical protein
MRHFLPPALSPPVLPSGMMQPASKRLLVAGAGPVQAIATRLPRASTPAVTLPMIAAPANPQLLPATRTVQQPIGLDDTHHFSRRPSTGQRTVIASCSKQRENAYGGDRYNDHHADSRKARTRSVNRVTADRRFWNGSCDAAVGATAGCYAAVC